MFKMVKITQILTFKKCYCSMKLNPPQSRPGARECGGQGQIDLHEHGLAIHERVEGDTWPLRTRYTSQERGGLNPSPSSMRKACCDHEVQDTSYQISTICT